MSLLNSVPSKRSKEVLISSRLRLVCNSRVGAYAKISVEVDLSNIEGLQTEHN